jgi:hypothetical protein
LSAKPHRRQANAEAEVRHAIAPLNKLADDRLAAGFGGIERLFVRGARTRGGFAGVTDADEEGAERQSLAVVNRRGKTPQLPSPADPTQGETILLCYLSDPNCTAGGLVARSSAFELRDWHLSFFWVSPRV